MSRRSIANQVGDEPIEVLARRPSQAKRDRTWEKEQRRKAGVATYRGIPQALNKQIADVARELGVPVGDIARAFLEYGLKAYRAGDLSLSPALATGRYTLYPPERS